jgi:hypothetical protein
MISNQLYCKFLDRTNQISRRLVEETFRKNFWKLLLERMKLANNVREEELRLDALNFDRAVVRWYRLSREQRLTAPTYGLRRRLWAAGGLSPKQAFGGTHLRKQSNRVTCAVVRFTLTSQAVNHPRLGWSSLGPSLAFDEHTYTAPRDRGTVRCMCGSHGFPGNKVILHWGREV